MPRSSDLVFRRTAGGRQRTEAWQRRVREVETPTSSGPSAMLERLFRLSENQTNARTELLAGVTTFLTMAYIIFVQPAVLSGAMFGKPTGMDFGAVTTATCLSAALATAIMALYARYRSEERRVGKE